VSAPLCRNAACRCQLERRTTGTGYKGAYGYCRACLERWNREGRPVSGPPEPIPAPVRNAAWREHLAAGREARIAEYGRLKARRFTTAGAAWRMGISVRTAQAYGRELQRQQRERTAA
jgi:hypothetical protein